MQKPSVSDSNLIYRFLREAVSKPYFSFITILLTITFTFTSVLLFPDRSNSYTDKSTLQKTIMTAISNGADLSTVKHLVANAPFEGTSLFSTTFTSKKLTSYTPDVTVDLVVSDIKAYIYTSRVDSSTQLLTRVNLLIRENNELHPFDALNSNQRYFFENVRIKSGSLYATIAEDLNNISSELSNSNKLVSEYLSDSAWSFRLSIAAIIIAVVTGLMTTIQFVRKRKTTSNED